MCKRIRMLTAIRRNNTKRNQNEFIKSLYQSTGFRIAASDFIEPDHSVRLEMHVHKMGDIIRQRPGFWKNGVTWDEVEKQFYKLRNTCKAENIVVALSQHWDFVFLSKLDLIATYAKSLLDFDGNTLEIFDGNYAPLLFVDKYTSEITGSQEYALLTSFPRVPTKDSLGPAEQ